MERTRAKDQLLSVLSEYRDDSQGVDSIMGNAMDLMTQQNIPGLPGSHPHNNLPGRIINCFLTLHGYSPFLLVLQKIKKYSLITMID